MPLRHVEKQYPPDAYYHIFNKGVGGQPIFTEEKDYTVFLNLLRRYLGDESVKDKYGREYPSYHQEIQLQAYCLMPNHYHLLVFQVKPRAISELLRSVCTSYTRYFNKSHRRAGHLFQDRFKATLIQNDSHLIHISRYIHLNPDEYRSWKFSSLPYYLGEKKASWMQPEPMLELMKGESYINFLADYGEHRKMLKEVKAELADS